MSPKRKIVIGVAALAAIAGSGVAVGATQFGAPREESRAVTDDAAGRLGVSPERLTDALQDAFKARIDEAVQSGRLSQAEGERLKARVEADGVPLLAPGFHRRGFRVHHARKLYVAAGYLGLSEAALRSRLHEGGTLAQVARDRGKSVGGLVDALFAESRRRIDLGVDSGRLTQADAARLLARLRARISDFVNGRLPALPRFHRRGHPGFGPHFRRGERPRFPREQTELSAPL